MDWFLILSTNMNVIGIMPHTLEIPLVISVKEFRNIVDWVVVVIFLNTTFNVNQL